MKKFGSGLVNVDLDDLAVILCLSILATAFVGAVYFMITGDV
jgi:hypothetical protein